MRTRWDSVLQLAPFEGTPEAAMFETAGPLAIVQPVLILVGLIVLPLVWTLVAAASALFGRSARTLATNERAATPIVAIGGAVSTLGVAIFLAVRLGVLPHGHVLVQHVVQLARLGQLDLAFDLVLDARSATFAVVVGIVACASVILTVTSSRPGQDARLAWTGLLTSGAMLLCIADGFAPLLVGLGVLSLGAWGASRGAEPAANFAALGGNVSVLLGLVFLFWSLGGTFGPEGYDPDGAPRFVLVTTNAPSDQPDQAKLVMTTHRGALVSSDDSDLPEEPIASPFAIGVDPGVQTLRVHRGVASGDVVVPRVALRSGRTHVLAPYGPTASLRVLEDQFLVPRLDPTGSTLTTRAALAKRTINGLRASAIVLLLVIGGALLHLHALATRRGSSVLGSVLEALPAPWLALRLSPLMDPSAADGTLVVLLGIGSAVVLGGRASCANDGHKALRGVLASVASVAVAAAGLGEGSATLLLACMSVVATSAALAAVEARSDPRWLGMACAGIIGLLPGAGASSGYIFTAMAALSSAPSTHTPSAFFGGAVAVATVAACTLAGLASFRVYHALSCTSVRDLRPPRAVGALVIVVVVVTLMGGAVLGAGTTMFGGQVVPLARRITGPTAIATARVSAGAAVVLSLMAAGMGVLLARHASAASSPPRWLFALGWPHAVFSWTASALGHGALFFQRSVKVMDRYVVKDVPDAVGEFMLRFARGLGRIGRKISGTFDPALERVAGFAIVRLDLEAPHVADRFLAVALLVMVAVLGLVVLSSLLFG